MNFSRLMPQARGALRTSCVISRVIRIRMVQIVSDENNSRRISKSELKSRINELEKRLGYIENYITEKDLYDEVLEYVEEAIVAYEELPFE